MDRTTSPGRIAEVIARYNADIVALQEVSSGMVRPARNDQAREISMYLEGLFPSQPPFHIEKERCGNVILSRYPMRLVKAGGLVLRRDTTAQSETRGLVGGSRGVGPPNSAYQYASRPHSPGTSFAGTGSHWTGMAHKPGLSLAHRSLRRFQCSAGLGSPQVYSGNTPGCENQQFFRASRQDMA